MLHEAIAGLAVKPSGTYVDCTLGAGGHSELLLQGLSPQGHLYSFDQDQTAITYNQDRFSKSDSKEKITFIKANFRFLKEELKKYGVKEVDGIVYDLGVSSPQFDDAKRGFSYRYDAPLDMRMDQSQELNAQTVVNEWPYSELVRIFFRYGEEKYAKSIARRIEKRRALQRVVTTGELVDLIKEAIPARARRTGGHPAKRVFQAIRIAVNDELGALEESLEQALDLLKVDGRVSVITFQSLEDRLVKGIFREESSLPDLPPGLPMIPKEYEPDYKLITRKPIVPNEEEVAKNRRAHSAKLRIIKRIKE